MNIATFKRIAPILFKHNIVPYLHGNQGLGKTQVTGQIADMMREMRDDKNFGFIPLHLATQEVGDLVGLLVKDNAGNVRHARPEWMPTSGQGVVFLDEVNRAHPEVLSCMYSFLTEKTIHSHKLPDGWVIAAAGNYDSNRFTVTNTSDTAFKSRFCHIDFVPSVEEFVAFAETRGAKDVAAFIRENPTLLEAKTDAGQFNVAPEPDRRAWLEKLARLESEDLGDARFEVYAGCIGTAAAAAFMSWKSKPERAISINEILTNYKTIQARVLKMSSTEEGNERRFDALNQPIDELMSRLESEQTLLEDKTKLENIKQFLIDVPRELALKAFNRMGKITIFSGKNDILNNPEYVANFKNNATK